MNKLIVALIGIFLLIFTIALYTPMQSDDYSFYLMGLSVDAHLKFYMTWSGRLIADYLSTILLAINNHFIVAFISSLAVPILLYNIVTTPIPVTLTNSNRNVLGIIILILFVVYWLANPALGQTTFWLVGQCNYLWPLVFVSAYIKYLIKFIYQTSLLYKHYIFIVILALLSGCSNEATGILVLYFTVALLLFAFFNQINNKKLILVGLAVLLLGYAILILAPGNFVRATHPEFASWYAIPLTERLYNHFVIFIPNLLKSYGVVYFVLIWALFQGRKAFTKQQWQLIAINLVATLGFAVVLVASPGAAQSRTHLIGLFFLLVACSFALTVALQGQYISRLAKVLFIGLLGYFITSYSIVFLAYKALTDQSDIRISIIKEQKAKNVNNILIPNYFAPFVLRKGDLPEIYYHSSSSMAAYYGVDKINVIFMDFNYERFLNADCNVELIDVSQSKVACLYKQDQFLTNNTVFILRFDVGFNLINKDTTFSLKVANDVNETDERYYAITLPIRIIPIGNKNFASITVPSSLLYVNRQTKTYVTLFSTKNGGLYEKIAQGFIN